MFGPLLVPETSAREVSSLAAAGRGGQPQYLTATRVSITGAPYSRHDPM